MSYDIEDRFVDALVKSVLVGGVIALGGATAYAAIMIPKDLGEANDKVVIEENVAINNDLSRFTGSAFTVSQSNNEYFVELFGVVIKTPGASPTFSSLSYNVDKEFYEKAFKYVDIEYNYGKDGQLIGAENKLREDLSLLLPSTKARVAQSDLIKSLVEITTQRALSINELGNQKDLLSAAQNDGKDSKLAITNITKPALNAKNKTISFNIQAITDVEHTGADKGKLTVKTFEVTLPATRQIMENPMQVYQDYLKGKGKFALLNHEALTLGKDSRTQIQNDFGAKAEEQANYSIEF